MAVDLQQYATDDQAFIKQAQDAKNAKLTQESLQGDQQQQPSFVSKFMTSVGRATTDTLDWAVSSADSINTMRDRAAHDVGAGIVTGAANIADAAGSAISSSGKGLAAAEDPANADAAAEGSLPTSPIWDHAKSSILDFRDAIAVKDPTLGDNLLQAGAQLAVPFAGYSRMLSGVHGFANMVAGGALTDATALGPHDARLADLVALGRHTEGKFGDTLRALAPDGSAVHAYINYLTDRGDETEAEGRFKNVLDGMGSNMVITPLLAAVGGVLKQGTAGLRYAIDNGVGSTGGFAGDPAAMGNQAGKIVFHGTRADIPPGAAFDNDKLLTGEGTNAFGAGHYFAENPATAGTYARRGVSGQTGAAISDAQNAIKMAGNDPRKAFQQLTSMAENEQDAGLRSRMQQAAKIIKSGNYERGSGNLYSVDIPDEHIAKMVDWDAPLSEQPEAVRETFAAHGINEANMTGGDAYKLLSSKLDRALGGADEAYQKGSGGDRAASALLHMRGVPGVRFLDSGSRTAGEGTRNLVLFNGKDAKVVGKNGKSFTGQTPTNMNLSKEERAAERERVAALRDKEAGGGREFEPEPIPARAAEHEGVVARRRKGDK